MTNFNCEPNTWHIYDSLFSESYLKSMKYILKTFSEINKEIDFFIILHRDVQRQKGPNDCGLFVLAFLFALCEGKNPSLINFKQSEMRKHYTDCIENGKFSDFPSTEIGNHKTIDTTYIFDCKTSKITDNSKKYK